MNGRHDPLRWLVRAWLGCLLLGTLGLALTVPVASPLLGYPAWRLHRWHRKEG